MMAATHFTGTLAATCQASVGRLDVHITDSDLAVGGAIGTGYRSTCGISKGILASGEDSLGRGRFDARALRGGLT
jgi:hypothetical protein